jgi:hypothetical protein
MVTPEEIKPMRSGRGSVTMAGMFDDWIPPERRRGYSDAEVGLVPPFDPRLEG